MKAPTVYAAISISLLYCASARAEINVGESVEWLVARAGRIVVGKIAKVQPERPDAQGKMRNLTLVTLHATETIKGAPQAVYCVGVRDVKPDVLERYREQGAELLLFLDETIQATSFGGRPCNLWPLRGEGDSVPIIIPLGDPGKRILHAGSFQVIQDRTAILSTCRDLVKRLAAGAAPKRVLLEVPFHSAVWKVLYSGSSCYLAVPDALFPKAKTGFR